MTTKNFKVGQTAYILEEGHRASLGTVTEIEVAKVGRRYVTVRKGQQETRFYEPVNSTTCVKSSTQSRRPKPARKGERGR